MKSLIIVMIFVATTVTATAEKGAARPEKRQISSYGGVAVQPPAGPANPQPTPASGAFVPANQPSYLPTCVVQPYGIPPIPAYQPSYVPAEPYVPQYYPSVFQPASQYPVANQPSQYPVANQPSQYPVANQLSQYPVGYPSSQYPFQPQYPFAYQPQQQPSSAAAAPYSYSYFSGVTNGNGNVQPSSTKK